MTYRPAWGGGGVGSVVGELATNREGGTLPGLAHQKSPESEYQDGEQQEFQKQRSVFPHWFRVSGPEQSYRIAWSAAITPVMPRTEARMPAVELAASERPQAPDLRHGP